MIAKRVPPTITYDLIMTRIIRDIYEVLNELIDVVGKYETSPPDQSAGRTGEVRVVKMGDNTFRVSIRSGEGWVTSTSGTFEFQERI